MERSAAPADHQVRAISQCMSFWVDDLLCRYHDGYRALDLDQPDINMQTFFYPKYWLDATGYWNNKPNTGPGVILFDSDPAPSSVAVMGTIVLTALASSLVTLFLGAYWVRYQTKNRRFQNNEYISINL